MGALNEFRSTELLSSGTEHTPLIRSKSCHGIARRVRMHDRGIDLHVDVRVECRLESSFECGRGLGIKFIEIVHKL